MTTWIDPMFDEAITKAGLIALCRVVDADPRGARVEVLRVLAGTVRPGENVVVRRAEVVGRGHEANALPRGETFVFVLPGSRGACRDAWEGILRAQLDSRHKPCNFVELMPRLSER